MFELLSILPLPFWAVIGLLIGGGFWALGHLRNGTGLPILAVLVTVSVWYVGDVFYNDYANNHARVFNSETLESAWWEVAWFLVVFLVAVPLVHQRMNARDLRRTSGVLQMFKYGVNQPEFQNQLGRLFKGCLVIWAILGVFAIIRLQGEVLHYFFPFIGYKAEPWGRSRVGGGIDALLTLAFYFQLITSAVFGIGAALFTDRRLRALALVFCGLAWPYFLLDRTRNTMLAVVIPGVLCWGLLRIRGSLLKKTIILAGCFILVNAWMTFVIANRSDMTMMQALNTKGFTLTNKEKTHQGGLNMFEELCWINAFIQKGTYNPDWGSRYFAELVNPIPRILWSGKPMVGIDYAIARGQGTSNETQAGGQAGVYATVSTGMIGQGVVNFGGILGPVAAAILMSIWVALLARQDLHIGELGRLPLYAVGLILTFNLGRDITFITLYPFVFGLLILRWLDRYRQQHANRANVRARSASRGNFQNPKSPMEIIPQAPLRRRPPGM